MDSDHQLVEVWIKATTKKRENKKEKWDGRRIWNDEINNVCTKIRGVRVGRRGYRRKVRDDGDEGKVGIERNEERVGDGARKKVGMVGYRMYRGEKRARRRLRE